MEKEAEQKRKNKITDVEYVFPPKSFHDKVIYFLDLFPIKDFEEYQRAKSFLLSDTRGNYQFYKGLRWRFSEFLERLSKKEPDEVRSFSEGPWIDIGIGLAQQGHLTLAEDFYKTLYRNLLSLQDATGNRLHKGASLHQIGWVNLFLTGRAKRAKKYFQLAMIEDVIDDQPSYAFRPAFIVLSNEYQIPESELDALANNVTSRLEEGVSPLFPEKFLLSFTLDEGIAKVRDSDRELFDINHIFAKASFELARKENTSSTEKGKALEELIAYLFSSISGFEVRSDVRTRDAQHDLIIRNTIQEDPIFQEFGRYILVECKNWENPVGVKEVRDFISKIRFAYCTSGIMVAKNGVTGSSDDREKDKRDAELVILKEFHQDNIVVIVLDGEDLEHIVSGRTNLLTVLLNAYEGVKLDKKRET